MNKVFVEENGVYQIDLSAADSAVGDLKDKYKSIGNILSDVDFIAETETGIVFIEYKNTDVENAANPEAFKEKIDNGKLYEDVVKKFYGSSYYMLACEKKKPISYIFVIESTYADSFWRKRAWASIKKRLPYKLQELNEITVDLILDFEVLSLQEWNEHELYAIFPLRKISQT